MNYLFGKEIKVEDGNKEIFGIARRILENGSLEVETKDGIEEVVVGNIHIV
jgi:biotin-(acetyl-CoA carboxylase) ligase